MKSASGALPGKQTEIVVPFRRIHDRREELAFLPAALEIVETPPSPIGRMIVVTIAALFCADAMPADSTTMPADSNRIERRMKISP